MVVPLVGSTCAWWYLYWVLPVHGGLCSELPGLRLQEVTDGECVCEELCEGVERHGVHVGGALAQLRPLGACWELTARPARQT